MLCAAGGTDRTGGIIHFYSASGRAAAGDLTRNIIGIILACIFGGLSVLHIYWAAGGRLGKAAAVPTAGGEPAFEPTTSTTLLVAAGLAAAMLIIFGGLGLFGEVVAPVTFAWLTLAIALLFLMRAIGDFGLVGFFKQPSDSKFAYWDTRLYSPLCLAVTLLAFVFLYLRP